MHRGSEVQRTAPHPALEVREGFPEVVIRAEPRKTKNKSYPDREREGGKECPLQLSWSSTAVSQVLMVKGLTSLVSFRISYGFRGKAGSGFILFLDSTEGHGLCERSSSPGQPHTHDTAFPTLG